MTRPAPFAQSLVHDDAGRPMPRDLRCGRIDACAPKGTRPGASHRAPTRA
ncbi:hypothetical protein DA2_3628 [Desulfovibrio sp. A2]|nr:hypothetical protein DA2_3628 [Desulfovibrio sp. A2]